MVNNRKYFLIIEIFIVLIIGVWMVYTSSNVWAQYKFDDPMYFLKRQIIFCIIGLFMMFIGSKIKLSICIKYNKLLFMIGILTLLLVLIPGIGVLRNGSRSWFQIGSFLLQPSEFFKIIIVMFVSDLLAKKKRIKTIKDFIIPLIAAIIGFLLILLQPDFGSGMVMLCTVMFIMFCAGVPYRYFIGLFLLGLVGLFLLIVSAPYRMKRILSFLDPWSDPLGSGFQIIQSLFAIGPAGLFGKGIGNSIQKRFYLPEPQTDFIFAVYAEEFGFLGCIFLVVLYFLIIYHGMQLAKSCTDKYTSYVCIGIISIFAIQVMINLGVVIGLFPVTGITLPLLSYGGSSMLVMLTCFGILVGNTEA